MKSVNIIPGSFPKLAPSKSNNRKLNTLLASTQSFSSRDNLKLPPTPTPKTQLDIKQTVDNLQNKRIEINTECISQIDKIKSVGLMLFSVYRW